jgi:uncharacterized protein YegL
MANQSLFTTTEWRTLQFTPLWIFAAVASADGKIDKKELEALAKELAEANQYKEQLAKDVLITLGNDFSNLLQQFRNDTRGVQNGLVEVANLLDRKVSPQTAYNFKGSMLMIGYNIYEATEKTFFGGVNKKAMEKKQRVLDAVAMVLRFSLAAAPATPTINPAAPPASPPKPVAPPTTQKQTSFYLVVDSSRHISDIAYLLDTGIRRLPEKIRGRTQRGVAVNISLILADSTGRMVTPLTEAAQFSAPSLLGRGTCGLGMALNTLLNDVSSHPADGKPLIVIVVAGPPEDNWSPAADQLYNLVTQGKANVFVIGVGGYCDRTVLRRLTTMTPLSLSDVNETNMEKSFDWMYSITDVILSGMESGVSSGARRDVPPPPACLSIVN